MDIDCKKKYSSSNKNTISKQKLVDLAVENGMLTRSRAMKMIKKELCKKLLKILGKTKQSKSKSSDKSDKNPPVSLKKNDFSEEGKEKNIKTMTPLEKFIEQFKTIRFCSYYLRSEDGNPIIEQHGDLLGNNLENFKKLLSQQQDKVIIKYVESLMKNVNDLSEIIREQDEECIVSKLEKLSLN
jgi:hypothetical protein